jgi:hypothetical protein
MFLASQEHQSRQYFRVLEIPAFFHKDKSNNDKWEAWKFLKDDSIARAQGKGMGKSPYLPGVKAEKLRYRKNKEVSSDSESSHEKRPKPNSFWKTLSPAVPWLK